MSQSQKKIWIDLDNTPHVPFFAPIIESLDRRGYSVMVTARRCFQVCALADLFGLSYRPIGRHYGRHLSMKALGLGLRSAQLLPAAIECRPGLAVSHGSRSQLLAASLLRIPSVMVLDYEHAQFPPLLSPTWVVAPEVIPDEVIRFDRHKIWHYPGIKEDVYAPSFRPDSRLRAELGIGDGRILVTARPPANEAHYYNPESDALFDCAIDLLGRHPEATIVLLPRNARQATQIKRSWAHLISSGKLVVPDKALDGLNLIWNSDLVVSGGGTMNREAAALHVPVYSVFRGPLGAVDSHLASRGRLVLLETTADVRSRLKVVRRDRDVSRSPAATALAAIVDYICQMVESPKGIEASQAACSAASHKAS